MASDEQLNAVQRHICYIAESNNYTESLRVEAAKALALLEIARTYREQSNKE